MNDFYETALQSWSEMWDGVTVAGEVATMYYRRSQAIM